MKLRKVALIIFYDKDKRILLQNREGISKLGEKWGYFGGGIEEGETPQQAVVRETKEELNYDLKEFSYIGTFSDDVNGMRIEMDAYISPLPDLSKFRQKEGKSMQLFSLEDAMDVLSAQRDKDVIKKLEKIL